MQTGGASAPLSSSETEQILSKSGGIFVCYEQKQSTFFSYVYFSFDFSPEKAFCSNAVALVSSLGHGYTNLLQKGKGESTTWKRSSIQAATQSTLLIWGLQV